MHKRSLNPALHGCETFDFAPDDLAALRRRLREYSAFSVHAPLPTPLDYPGSPTTSFLLDPDPAKRLASLDMLKQTIELSAAWGALYVVVHFGGLHSDGLSAQQVLALADGAAAQLSAWAQEHAMPLYLEYAAYNPHFATPEALVDLVRRYSGLDICLDVGHLRLSAQMLGVDEWQIARLLLPYVRSMHLWTTRRGEDARRYHHVPVHPSLTPEHGWIDIPRMLAFVLDASPDCAIVFEPNDLYNSDPDWQAEGMTWVQGLVAKYRS